MPKLLLWLGVSYLEGVMFVQWLYLANVTAKKMTMLLLTHKTPQTTYFFRIYLKGFAETQYARRTPWNSCKTGIEL